MTSLTCHAHTHHTARLLNVRPPFGGSVLIVLHVRTCAAPMPCRHAPHSPLPHHLAFPTPFGIVGEDALGCGAGHSDGERGRVVAVGTGRAGGA